MDISLTFDKMKLIHSQALKHKNTSSKNYNSCDIPRLCFELGRLSNLYSKSSLLQIYQFQNYVSYKPLHSLELISFHELTVETRASGKYLICQTLENSIQTNSIFTIAQDHLGNVQTITVYHLFNEISPDQIIPKSSILVIKEPLFKYVKSSTYTILVQNPTDIIFVHPCDSLFKSLGLSDIKWNFKVTPNNSNPNPKTLKHIGNQLYQTKKFKSAIYEYTTAISLEANSQNDLAILYLNRSACFLELSQYDSALKDAIKTLEILPQNEKALFRAGSACYKILQFERCLQFWIKLAELYPTENNILSVQNAQLRITEMTTGIYNMQDIQSKYSKTKFVDIANYLGPIKVVDIDDKGRGYVATEDIIPGTLLIAAKAIASSFVNNLKTPILHYNYQTKKMTLPDQYQLITNVCHRLMNDKIAATEFFKLASGSHAACSNDVFGDDQETELIIDTDLINSICNHNSFVLEGFEDIPTNIFVNYSGHLEYDTNHLGSGLFITPAYLNHACFHNAARYFIGDAVFIHSTLLIKKGEEVAISYINPLDPQPIRQQNLENHGFICTCKMCREDNSEERTIFQKRQDLLHHFSQNIIPRIQTGDESVIDLAEKYIKDITTTFDNSGRTNYRYDLIQPAIALGSLYEKSRKFEKAIVCYKLPFQLCGLNAYEIALDDFNCLNKSDAFVSELLIQCALHVAVDYIDLKLRDDAQTWYLVGLNLGRLIYGMDKGTFRSAFKDFTVDLNF